jgi:dihydrofolate reductase
VKMMVKLSIIVAAARNGVIGKNNQLPWHLPQDLKYFRAMTTGKPVIMGRKTFESIGKPLPNRTNIVITRNTNWVHDGVLVVNDLIEAVEKAKKMLMQQDNSELEAMIIGGAEIYKTALTIVDRVYLTYIDRDVDGDAWFPVLSSTEWYLSKVQKGEEFASEPYEFRVYDRLESAG